MSETEVLPELKQIVGAMLFVARHPLKPEELLQVLQRTAADYGGVATGYAEATLEQVREAVEALRAELDRGGLGMRLVEVGGGFRMENDSACGRWLRTMLRKGKPARLSRPALETLAVVAYRQPCVRSEIEAVRGVAADAILRNLLDMQLVRIVGRSELPGRPWLFGTTQKFLEHFGLNTVDELPGVEELRRMEAGQLRKQETEQRAEPESETVGIVEEADPVVVVDETEDVFEDDENGNEDDRS